MPGISDLCATKYIIGDGGSCPEAVRPAGFHILHLCASARASLYTEEPKSRPSWCCQILPSVSAVPAARNQARGSAPQRRTLPGMQTAIPIFHLKTQILLDVICPVPP